MKKKTDVLKRINNNRGIALISILIAVAFISIIGSALLYITYTNFQMKVMNNRSKANFYETDGELVNVVTLLRNSAADPESTVQTQNNWDNHATLSDTAYSSAFILTDDAGNVTGYDISRVLSAAGVSSSYTDAKGDRFVIKTKGNAVRLAENQYVLQDFEVVQKANDKDGSYNKVKTDVVLKLKEVSSAPGGKTGVGECSMIFDSSLSCSSDSKADGFSFLTLYGDAYYSSYYYGTSGNEFPDFGGSGMYTQPGAYMPSDPTNENSKPALKLSGETKINFCNNYMVVFGDLVLEDDSCLNIDHGSLTVYGDIYLLDNSTLICGGKIYQPKTTLPGRGAECMYYVGDSSSASQATSVDLAKHLYYPNQDNTKNAPKVSEEVTDDNYKDFCKLLHLNDDDAKNDGITPQIIKTVEYKKSDGSVYKSDFDITRDITQMVSNLDYTTTYYGRTVGVKFYWGDVINNEYPDRLVFMCNPRVDGGVSTQYAEEWEAHPDYAVKVEVQPDPNNPYWKKNMWTWEGTPMGGAAVTELKSSNIRSTYISANPIHLAVQHGAYISKMGDDVYQYLTQPTEGDPYYDATSLGGTKGGIHHFNFDLSSMGQSGGTQNYFSAGDFLQTDANPKIQLLFNYGVNGGTEEPTYINSVSFSKYVKDAE